MSINSAVADDTATIRTLRQELMEKYKIGLDDIVRLLWFSKADVLNDFEPRFVRWPTDTLNIEVLTTENVATAASEFTSRMDETASIAGRHVKLCTRQILMNEDGGYSPRLQDLGCLHEPHEIVLLIDTTPNGAMTIFPSLRLTAPTLDEDIFWKYREEANPEYFARTTCGAHMSIDLRSSAVTSGAAYLRVADRGERLIECLDQLPYWIFTQVPIRDPEGHPIFTKEMLQLSNQPALQAGMTMSQVTSILAQ